MSELPINKLQEAFQKALLEAENKKILDEKQSKQRSDELASLEADRILLQQKKSVEELKIMPTKQALAKEIWERIEWLVTCNEIKTVFKKNRTSEIKIHYSKPYAGCREYEYLYLLAFGALKYQKHWGGMFGGGSHEPKIIISADELADIFNLQYIQELHDLVTSDKIYSKLFEQL